MAAEKNPKRKLLLAIEAGEWLTLIKQLSMEYQIIAVSGEENVVRELTDEKTKCSACLIDAKVYGKLQKSEAGRETLAAALERMPLFLLFHTEVPETVTADLPVTDIIVEKNDRMFASGRIDRAIQMFRLQTLMQAHPETAFQCWEKLMWTDTMTGLYNRRYCMERIEALLAEQTEFCVCFADADCLKQVNDTYGHEAGDTYIVSIAETLEQVLSEPMTACRIYGDEFVVILPECTAEKAGRLMGGVNRVLAVKSDMLPFDMGISYGILQVESGSGLSVRAILNCADQKMYVHKTEKAGRTAGVLHG